MTLPETGTETADKRRSMQEFGTLFIADLPKHIQSLHIPGRKISENFSTTPRFVQVDKISELQQAMRDVLSDPITRQAETYAENAFSAFLGKDTIDNGILQFFNGWNDIHKTTSLVSAKILMRLSRDKISIPTEQQAAYCQATAHMYEVVKDDYGLGHRGHDGMYCHLAEALNATDWHETRYQVQECTDFSNFLYEVGVSEHTSPMNSDRHNDSILKAIMTSMASETWNGREFNYLAQYIEDQLISFNPTLVKNPTKMRCAKGYIIGHAGEVENKHGLHALAAAQLFAKTKGVEFHIHHLKAVMLDYNERVGKAFYAVHRALTKNTKTFDDSCMR